MTRRRSFLATLACALAALAGCGGSDSARTVTVVLDWTPNTNHAGIYLARERGYYAEAGLTVDIVEPDQNGALAQVAVGNAEFGFSAAEQLLPARAQGAKVISVAAVLRTNTSSLLMPADRAITRPRDLAGHTYGGFGGELETALVTSLVRCDGGDPTAVRFTEVGNVDYTVGFRRHQYDAVWVFDGWDTIRMRDMAGLPVTTIPFRANLDCIPDWYTPILVADERLADKEPQVVRAFVAATSRGYRDLAAAPATGAATVTATLPEADPDLWRRSATFIAPFLIGSGGRWGYQRPAVWRRFSAWLSAHDLPTETDVDRAFTNDFLPDR